MNVAARSHVSVAGPEGARPMVFVHGFGCDQSMWRLVAPGFTADHRVVLYDLAGCGRSDLAAYEPDRYTSLQGYADDLVRLLHELDLRDVVFVGHSVASMIGVLAQVADPGLFSALVLVGPSARYVDEPGYVGGFSEADIDELLHLVESNHLGWQDPLSTLVMGNPERPELKAEMEASFCRTRPDVAAQLARATFLGDNRADLERVSAPTLVLQTRHDAIAPVTAGEYVRDRIPGSRMVMIEGHGHCPHLSAPDETTAAIRSFLSA